MMADAVPPASAIPSVRSAVACVLFAAGFAAAHASDPTLPIGTGDTVHLRIAWGRGLETDDTWRVDEEGCIELPRIGRLKVSDLSEAEATSLVNESYNDAGIAAEATLTVWSGEPEGQLLRPVRGSVAPPSGPTTSPSTMAKWREVLRRVDVGRPGLAGIVATLMAAVALVWRGLRGRRVDDHPVCRRCRFDLFGLPARHPRCPECGTDLLRRPRRAVRVGNRERRAASLTAGILLLVPAAAALGVVVWSTWQRTDPYEWKPAWWLAYDLTSADANVQKAAIAELSNRLRAGKLSGGDVDRVARRVLALQGDPGRTWSTRLGDFVEDARGAQILTDERWQQYLLQGVPAEIEPPARVRRGSTFPVKVRVGPTRLGDPVRVRVEIIEPAIELAGRAADRDARPAVSSYVLWDAQSMTGGKLLVYDFARMPDGDTRGTHPVRLVVDLRLRHETHDSGSFKEAVRRAEWAGNIELFPADRPLNVDVAAP